MKTKRGFTLLELLIVIAIIGILSSVVLTAVNIAQVKGRDAARTSQVNQIVDAMSLYYDDNYAYPAPPGVTNNTYYCLGLTDGNYCWPFGAPDPGNPGAYLGHGSTALVNSMQPYMSRVPGDPLLGASGQFGDNYIYHYVSSSTQTLMWVVETCTPDVTPVYPVKQISPQTCLGGTIEQEPLSYGPGCHYSCELPLTN